MKNWKSSRLGDFLSVNENNLVRIEPTSSYLIAGVQNEGKGVLNKREVLGADLVMSYYKIVKPNQLLWCKVDTRRGAFGITKEENDNSFVSTNMHLADIDLNKANPQFITYLFQRKALHKIIEDLSQGSTNRRYAKKEQIFAIEIPLPSLPEQQRIVSKIESVKQPIKQIIKLRAEQAKEIGSLRYSVMVNVEKQFEKIPLHTVCDLQKGSFPIILTEAGDFPFVVTAAEFKTAISFDFDCEAVCVPLVSSTGHGNAAMHRVHYANGKFALSNLLCAVTTKDKNEVNTKFLFQLFMAMKDEYFVPLMKGTSNVSLNVNKIANVEIPLPPIEEQNRIVSLLDKLNAVKTNHTETDNELRELMPALLDKAFKGELISETNVYILPALQELESNYFVKRKVLATYIINQSLEDSNFGVTKFEKELHLSDYFAIMRNLNQNYIPKAAGPLDNKFTKNFFKQIENSKWFIRENKGSLYSFKAGLNHSKSLNTYNYFSREELGRVDKIIGCFRNYNYEQPEIVSTLYAVWNNRLIRQQEIDDKLLIEDFYKWDDSKKKYESTRLKNALEWMRNKTFIPNGWGKVI